MYQSAKVLRLSFISLVCKCIFLVRRSYLAYSSKLRQDLQGKIQFLRKKFYWHFKWHVIVKKFHLISSISIYIYKSLWKVDEIEHFAWTILNSLSIIRSFQTIAQSFFIVLVTCDKNFNVLHFASFWGFALIPLYFLSNNSSLFPRVRVCIRE